MPCGGDATTMAHVACTILNDHALLQKKIDCFYCFGKLIVDNDTLVSVAGGDSQ